MHPFSYRRPESLEAAIVAVETTPNGRFLAGGMAVIPAIKQRFARPSVLVDLAAIPDLDTIRIDGAQLTIGAMATHDAVASSPEVAGAIPGLAGLAGQIGDPQVRNRGTLGGAVANNDPASDYPAGLLALGATIRTDRRQIDAAKFFGDAFDTALFHGEIVVGVSIPIPELSAYVKIRQLASRYALVGVMVARSPWGVRVAVTGARPGVFREFNAELALSGSFTPSALDSIDIPSAGFVSNHHGSADYRAHLIKVLAKRAVAAAQ